MILFHNDYNQTCHPLVLKKMSQYASVQLDGYGEDVICKRAADLIRTKCHNEHLAVHFLSGGTQTNLTVIAASLRPHQAVLAASSAHIYVHETGSIEATGHKVISLDSDDGKISAKQIRHAVEAHWADTSHEHIAQPKMVYLSHPTEFGTTYTRTELVEISSICREKGLLLFVDGARLGYALAARDNTISLDDLAQFTDVFYIGGTKVGAMFGEAVVISNPVIADDFRYIIKQRGGMLAKGWLLGLQFEALFEEDLYLKISAHANKHADEVRSVLKAKGYQLAVAGTTNQIFAVLPNKILESIKQYFTYTFWERFDDNYSVVRFCTSWATTQEQTDALCKALKDF